MERISVKVAENTFWSFLRMIIVLTIGTAISVMLARTLGPVKMGHYSYAIWIIGIISIIVNLGLPSAVLKFVSEYLGRKDYQTAKNITLYIFKLESIISIIAVILAGLLILKFTHPDEHLFLLIAALSVIPSILDNVFGSAINGMQEYKLTSKIVVIVTSLQLVLFCIVLKLKLEIVGLIIALLAVNLSSLFLSMTVYSRLFKVSSFKTRGLPGDLKRRMFKYGGVVAVMLLIDAIVWQRSEVFFLKIYSSVESIGFYSIAFGLAGLAISIPRIFSNVLMPVFSGLYGLKDIQGIGKIYYYGIRYLAMLSIPIGFGGVAIAHSFINVLYGNDYLSCVPIFSIIVFFNIFGAISGICSLVLYSTENQIIVAKYGILVAILNIILDFLLIPAYGLLGAAMANSFTQCAAGIIGNILVITKFKFKFPVISFLKMVICAFIMFVIVKLLSNGFPDIVGLIISIVTGAGIYLICLSLFKVLDETDINLLKGLNERLPESVRLYYSQILNFLHR